MVNYYNIFLQKTGQFESSSRWDESRIQDFLDSAAYIVSRNSATPWADFSSVPDTCKYAVTLFAAIEYWWAKAGEYTSKFSQQLGGGTGQRAEEMFDRALRMIKVLTEEFNSLNDLDDGTGTILVGNLVIRSKNTGYLVPRDDDPYGDWVE